MRKTMPTTAICPGMLCFAAAQFPYCKHRGWAMDMFRGEPSGRTENLHVFFYLSMHITYDFIR